MPKFEQPNEQPTTENKPEEEKIYEISDEEDEALMEMNNEEEKEFAEKKGIPWDSGDVTVRYPDGRTEKMSTSSHDFGTIVEKEEE